MKNAGETLLQLRIMFIFVANVGPNMNKKLFFLLLFLSTANLISCNKNNPDKDTDNGDTSLWVALYDGEDAFSEFKDDKCYIYRDGNLQYTCPSSSAVVRKGTDIYALAFGESKAGKYSIWKNGKRLYGLDSEGGFPLDYAGACGLCVVNNDVYSCGTDAVFDSGGKLKSYKGRVWKNEKPILELESRGSLIWPYRILVEGTDIYVAGALDDPANKEKGPAVWKNGKLFFLGKGSGSGWDEIYDIRCYYGSLYYAGIQFNEGGGGPNPKIWKNNAVLYNLTGGCEWANVYNMAFKDSDLYAVGDRCRHTGGDVIFDGAIWKNGEIMWAIEDTEQTSIAIIGDDIYTAGIVETSNGKNGTNRLAQIWKNGKVYQTFDYCQEVPLINACN